jgi:hypothetical protein
MQLIYNNKVFQEELSPEKADKNYSSISELKMKSLRVGLRITTREYGRILGWRMSTSSCKSGLFGKYKLRNNKSRPLDSGSLGCFQKYIVSKNPVRAVMWCIKSRSGGLCSSTRKARPKPTTLWPINFLLPWLSKG